MTDAPDLTTYHSIHAALRSTSRAFRDAVADVPATDPARARALAWWFEGFASELHHHHTVEDEVFFPAVARLVPTYQEHGESLAADHGRMDDIIDALRVAVGRMADGLSWDRSRDEAVALAAELHALLEVHLDHEDGDVLPLFERHFTAAEYEQLEKRAVAGLSLRQATFTVPWMLATMTPEEQQRLLADAPLPLVVVWRLFRGRYARRASLALGTPVGVATS
jgi:hemerythrin-like domain-containing protein